MKCTVPGINVKVLGRAIHSLAKIGEELYVEPLPNGLALRTVNSSRSAYGCFLFAPSFFTKYTAGSGRRVAENGADENNDDESVVRCRILMKSCLSVFKSLSTLDRTVDCCKILLNAPQSLIRFQLHCRHGIVKTHNLSFIECETLQAVYSKDLSPNVLTAQSRLLCDIVNNFQPSQLEVTLCLTPEKVAVKNYVDDEPDPNKVMRTEMSLLPDEFETFQAGVDADITFCLKELRAILSFSEAGNLPVTIRFQTAGTPIVFSLDSEATYEANFVLATLAANQADDDNMTSQKQTTTRNERASTAIAKSTAKQQTGRKQRLYNGSGARYSASTSRFMGDTSCSTADTLHADTAAAVRSRLAATGHDSSGRAGDAMAPTLHGHTDDTAMPAQVSCVAGRRNYDVSRLQQDTSAADACSSSEHRGEGDSRTKPMGLLLMESDEEETADVLPATPPSKKFKSLFFGTSQSSQSAAITTPVGKVLVADSDDDS